LAIAFGLNVNVVCPVTIGHGAGGWVEVKVKRMFPVNPEGGV